MTRSRDLSEIVNSTGLSVDTDTLVVDSANNRVGVGTASPSTKLHLGGSAPLDSIIRQDSTVSGTNWEIGERAAGKWQIFEDDTDSVVATFQSNGNVGIGVTNPTDYYAEHLVIAADDEGGITLVSDPAHQAYVMFADGTSGSQAYRGYFGYDHGSDFLNIVSSGTIRFYSDDPATEALRIDSNGQVGIGYTPDAWSTSLDVIQLGTARGSSVVAGTSGYSVNNHLFMTNNGYAGNEWYYTNGTTALQYYLEGTGNHIWNYAAAGVAGETTTIVSGRKYEITSGTPSPDLTGFGATTNNVGEVFIATGNTTITGGAVTQAILWNEAMRIDTAGNLLVGTTDNSGGIAGSTEEGIALSAGTFGGFLGVSRSGNIPACFNRQTTEGDIVLFRKDGTDVGSIGTEGGDLTIGTGVVGIQFGDAGDYIRPWNMSTNANRDASIDLGVSTSRFKDLYLEGNITLSRDAHSTTKDVVNISTAQFDAGVTFQTGEFILFGDWDGSSDKMLALKRAGSDVLAVDASGNLQSPGFSKISGIKSCPENATTSLGYLTFNANEHVVVRITITSSNLVTTNDYASAVGTRTIGVSHSGTVGGSINAGTLEAANVVIVHGGNSAILTGIDITEDSPSPGQLSINAVIGNNGTATSATVGYTIELLGGNANTLGWTTV
jgi:hypothetical protein